MQDRATISLLTQGPIFKKVNVSDLAGRFILKENLKNGVNFTRR